MFVVHVSMQSFAYDDAYIHFRIAENFITYGVPYFNPSEQVMVTSSSGWTLLVSGLALLSRLTTPLIDLCGWTAIFNGITTSLGCLLYLRLLRRAQPDRPRFIVQLLFGIAYLSQMIKPSLGLMETPFAMLLAGLALHQLLDNRPYSLLLFSLLPFFRPELAVLSLLATGYAIFVQRASLKRLLLLLLGALPMILFNLIFFGTLIPNTIHAKSLVYTLGYGETIAQFLARMIDDVFLLRLLNLFPSTHQLIYVFLFLILLSGILAIYLLQQAWKGLHQMIWQVDPFFLILLLWSIGLIGAYSVMRTKLFTWYEPLYLIPAWLGVCIALSSFQSKLSGWVAIPLIVSQGIGILEIILAIVVNPVIYQDFGETARVRRYLTVGQELYACYPQARLMTSEIGALGYAFHGYIYDGMDLASPSALSFHPMPIPDQRQSGSIGAIPVEFIQQEQPDIILSYDVFIESFLRSQIIGQYALYPIAILNENDQQLSGIQDVWGSKNLNIFINKDFLLSGSPACLSLGISP
jgi:hypothetical protein